MKPRRPATLEHAVTLCIAEMGAESCAEVIGRKPSLIHRASNPDDETMLTLEAGARLDAAFLQATGREGPIGVAFTAQVERLAACSPRHIPADPLERVTEVVKECSEAVEAYTASHPTASPNMRNIALGEIGEAIEALQAMARDLETQDRPVPLRARAE